MGSPVNPMKLAKVARLLFGTDQPGEIINARNLVLHAFGGDRERAAAALIAALPPQATPTAAASEPVRTTWQRAADWCREHEDRLWEKDRDLVETLIRYARSGRGPSERQLLWLGDVFNRLRAEMCG